MHADAFSPELRLILALLRSTLGTSVPPRDIGNINWPAFRSLAERHRVVAFLARRAPPTVSAFFPDETSRSLKSAAQTMARRALAQAADQFRLVRCLEETGVEVMVVKGLVLAQRLYGDLGVRHVGDIDLFIRATDVERADRALRAAGLNRFRPDIPLTPLQTKKFVRLKPEFEYRSSSSPLLRVELLWRLEGLPDSEETWTCAALGKLGGRDVRMLPPDLDALYVLQHGARHGWFRLFWLLDAALLLRDPSLDWEAIMHRARSLALERAPLQAAALAEELLGIPRPTALRPVAGERTVLAMLCAEARRQIARDAFEHEALAEWARQIIYRMRLKKTWSSKFSVLAPHLFTPESWRMWSLPDRWFFLYYLASPFLWLWRRVCRARQE